MNMSLLNGASESIVSSFDLKVLLETVQRDRITLLAGVPTIWNAMLQEVKRGTKVDFSSSRVGSSDGAALPLEALRGFQEQFNCTLLERNGLTETTSSATMHTLKISQKSGTVGVAAPGVEDLREFAGEQLSAYKISRLYRFVEELPKGSTGKILKRLLSSEELVDVSARMMIGVVPVWIMRFSDTVSDCEESRDD